MRINLYLIFGILFIQACACNQHNKKVAEKDLGQYKEPLVNVNKTLVNIDAERITAYGKRYNLDLQVNESGLFYHINKVGEGKKVEKLKVVTLAYKVYLLDGKLLYSSDSTGLKSFVVSQGNVENGLEIGILMLNEGSKAVFIMPPFLAHGLIGDEKKIPPRSIIRYDVEVIKVSDN